MRLVYACIIETYGAFFVLASLCRVCDLFFCLRYPADPSRITLFSAISPTWISNAKSAPKTNLNPVLIEE